MNTQNDDENALLSAQVAAQTRPGGRAGAQEGADAPRGEIGQESPAQEVGFQAARARCAWLGIEDGRDV